VDVNIQSQRSPYQDGGTFINAKLEVRDIFMQVAIASGNPKELFQLRQDIQRMFNPKLGEGLLIYETPNGKKMLNVAVDSMPIFSEYSSRIVVCQINLAANDPF